MTQFEVGKTYQTRSACDYDCFYTITVVKRTQKTITVAGNGLINGKTLRIKPYVLDGSIESVEPLGRYSMSPVIKANQPI